MTNRLNHKPIFIVGFQRGGTELLRNVIQSHPHVCIGEGETHQIFKGVRRRPLTLESAKIRASRLWRYLPILLRERRDLFSLYWFGKRGSIKSQSQRDIDRVFYSSKLNARHFTQNMYKDDGVYYELDEIKQSRFLSKNLQGLIFTTEMFQSIYPDATFIGLVRNGLAVCEGHIRRGTDPDAAGQMYQVGCQQMIKDEQRFDNYKIFRFEDLIDKPKETLERVYEFAQLDTSQVNKIRFVTKPVLTADGKHLHVHGTTKDELVWYDKNEYGKYFLPNINKTQHNNLNTEQEAVIKTAAASALHHFDYL